jgi:hypothetical protein
MPWSAISARAGCRPPEVINKRTCGHCSCTLRPVCHGHEGSLRVRNVDDFIPRLNQEVRCIETSDLIVFCNEDDGSVD